MKLKKDESFRVVSKDKVIYEITRYFKHCVVSLDHRETFSVLDKFIDSGFSDVDDDIPKEWYKLKNKHKVYSIAWQLKNFPKKLAKWLWIKIASSFF